MQGEGKRGFDRKETRKGGGYWKEMMRKGGEFVRETIVVVTKCGGDVVLYSVYIERERRLS